MQIANGKVTSIDQFGNTVEDQLFTYSEEEKQKHEIDHHNAELVWSLANIVVPTWIFKEGVTGNEALILGFILGYFGRGRTGRFYFTNEQMAGLFNLSISGVKKVIKSLTDKGFITCKYKMRAGGGQIRFVESTATKYPLQRSQSSRCNGHKVAVHIDVLNDVKINDVKHNAKFDNKLSISRNTGEDPIKLRMDKYYQSTGGYPPKATIDKWRARLDKGENIFV